MSNRERFPNLDSELIQILDDYDEAVKSGKLWIVHGHAVNTNNPGQVWVKLVNEKFAGTYSERD